ncbi:hypothetical protein IJ182_10820 [bacterium]|nr:hypothetical protein [bacterium]
MNPRLIKFVVDLQTTEEKEEESKKYIGFGSSGGGKNIFDIAKLAKVTVPVDRR